MRTGRGTPAIGCAKATGSSHPGWRAWRVRFGGPAPRELEGCDG